MLVCLYVYIYVTLTLSVLLTCFPHTGSDWVNLKDPTVLAETELLNAAAAIEAAAKKLEDLRPRPELVMHFTVAYYYV